MVIKINN